MVLLRVSETVHGTFGVLLDGDVPFALTLERPWRDNQQDVSSIPLGAYACKRVTSPKFGETFEITGVPNRSHVLFHKGNKLEDTKGCVLIGEKFDVQDGQPVIAESTQGYQEFMSRLKGRDAFNLIVHRWEMVTEA